MAEYDLTPIEVDDDLQGTYELLKKYFLRENNPFNILTDFSNEDGFTIDIVRSYSFIASTYRATVHLMGTPLEDGRTKVSFHAKSAEKQEILEKEIRDRIDETLRHMVAQKRNQPLSEPVDDAKVKKANRIELIVVLAVVALLIIGTLPISCSEQFSRFWIV